MIAGDCKAVLDYWHDTWLLFPVSNVVCLMSILHAGYHHHCHHIVTYKQQFKPRGGGVSCDIGERGWRWTWDLLLPSTFSSSNLLPPPSYSSQLLLPPPKPPPNSSYLLLKGLRWLISSYMKRFQCYSAQKSFMVGGGGGGDIAIIATSSRSRSPRDLR